MVCYQVYGDCPFGYPVNDRTTLTFDFDNFSKISVLGLADVTVVKGSDVSIEVTADADIINDVQVIQSGDTVSFDLSSYQIYNVVMMMPVLERIDVGANALANVTLKDFDQLQMTVNLDGVSVLRGEDLLIGDLTASVSGVSLLDFAGTRPIDNAYIDVSGVSQATLNMAVRSSLACSVSTGQGTGVSILFYYGTNVNVNVKTDALSILTWLGETRP